MYDMYDMVLYNVIRRVMNKVIPRKFLVMEPFEMDWKNGLDEFQFKWSKRSKIVATSVQV